MKQRFAKTLFLLILSFSTTNLIGQNINMFHGNQSASEGNFFDPGGPVADYPSTTAGSITFTLCSNVYDDFGSGYIPSQIQMRFSNFALGLNDTLFIYDGNSTSAPLIGSYNSVNSPGDLISTGQCLTFVFYSDGIADLNGLNMGWRASYAAYFDIPKPYNLDAATASLVEITSCNTILYDSGGPSGNFATGENNTIVFSSNMGTHIKAERVSFNTGTSSILEIFDGNLVVDPTNARRIGYFKNGYIPPQFLISSGPSLSFRFITQGTGAGFQFNLTCVPEIYEQDPGESACPRIELGRYSVTGPFVHENEFTFDCNNPMIILEADVNAPGLLTNDYTVQSIPYNPPFAWYGAGMTQVPTTQDDYWLGPKGLTPAVNPSGIPFSFAFYGTNYSNCVPGTNGAISFNNIAMSGAGYLYSQTIPNIADPAYTFINGNDHKNSIFGVFQDTYPGAGSPPPNSGIYYGNQGEFPCRTFVFSFYRLPQYSCTSDNLSTYQMVMYEGSNIIDVYIQQRTVCASWNTGSGLVGVLNQGGNQAVVPPGRNTGPWTTTNEAWRFIPITPTNYNVTWYRNEAIAANLIPNNNLDKKIISVFPEVTTNYIAKLEFTTSSNITYTLYDTIRIIVEKPEINATSAVPTVCPGEPVELSINTTDPDEEDMLSTFRWYEGTTLLGTDQTIEVSPTATTTYNVIITYVNNCENSDTISITVPELIKPVIEGDTTLCNGERSTLTVTVAEGTYLWSTGATSESIIVSPSETSEYTVDVTTPIGCVTKDSITVNVAVRPTAMFLPSPNHVYVENGEGPINFVNMSQNGTFYTWNFGDQHSLPSDNFSALESPIHIYTRSGKYKASLVVESEKGCIDSTHQFVTVEVPYFYYVPNSFTPNGDGINDFFYTSGEGVDPENFEMYLYSRNGNLIFKSVTPYDYWDGRTLDGTLAAAGVYVYVIITHDMEGNPKRYQGSVTLIR